MLRRAQDLQPALRALTFAAAISAAAPAAAGTRAEPRQALAAASHAVFVENAGQWDARALFGVGRGPANGWVVADGFVVDLRGEGETRGCVLGFRLAGAREARPVGVGEVLAPRQYLRAGTSAIAAAFEAVRYRSLLPGVDLVLRPGAGLFEYDLELAPGAGLDGVAIEVEGALGLALAEDGSLELRTELGVLRQSPPVAWTVGAGGEREPLACRFRLLDEARFGFEAPERPADRALVVDPGLEWGSYVGDYDHDTCYDLVEAANGDVIVVGTSSSPAFPTTRGTHDVGLSGASDAFVARVRPDGKRLVFATFLGGSGGEVAYAVELGPAGEIVVAGDTTSPDFPVTAGAYDTSHNGAADAFVVALAPDGKSVLLGTYLGGSGDERARDLAVDASFRVTVAGGTNSGGFPTTFSAFDTTFNGGTFGGGDAFVTRFAPNLASLEHSTFLGGTGTETATRLAVAANGETTVVGVTGSADFPVVFGSFDASPNGTGTFQDGFVTRLAANGGSLVWSSFLGGTGNDVVWGVDLRADGAAAVVGGTESASFPTTPGAFDLTHNGGEDAFVTIFAPNGASLERSTFLGGHDRDRGYAATFGPGGDLLVVGGTRSQGFPVTPWAWDDSMASLPDSGTGDGFLARMKPDGSFDYVSFLGGRQDEEALAVAAMADGRALVCGHTSSFDFPALSGFDTSHDLSGLPDGFVCRLELSRFPFAYGDPAPSSMGYVSEVGANFPSFSGGAHSIWIDLGVPHTDGWLFRGTGQASIPFHGTTLCVAPPFVRHSTVHLDVFGSKQVNIPVTGAMVGTTRYWQFWYLDPGSPSGFALSPGLEVTYYP